MKKSNIVLAFVIALFFWVSAEQAFTQRTSKIGPRGKMIELEKPKPKPTQTPKPKLIPKQLSFEVIVDGSGNFECEGGTCTWSIHRFYSGTVNMGSSVEVKRVFVKTGSGLDYNWRTNLPEGQKMFVSISDMTKETYQRKKRDKEDEKVSFINTWFTVDAAASTRGVVTVAWDSENTGFTLGFAVSPELLMTYQRKREPDDGVSFYESKEPVFQMPFIQGCIHSEIFIPLDGPFHEKTAQFDYSPPNCKTSEPLLLKIPETSNVAVTVKYKFN
jgi:hypothetical protein